MECGDYNCATYEKEIEICVLDSDNIVGKDEASIEPLIGRGLFDFFDVIFKGEDKHVCLYHVK